jgi:hypothetical protein
MSSVEIGALLTIFGMVALILWGQFGNDDDDYGNRK